MRALRIGAALALLGFLIFFFVPLVYDPKLFACYGWGGCLTNAAGLKSLGYWLFNWGGTYSFASGQGNSAQPGAYFAPPIGDLSTYGVLLYAAFPLVAAFIGLLAPEIMERSRAARIGFIAFGGVRPPVLGLPPGLDAARYRIARTRRRLDLPRPHLGGRCDGLLRASGYWKPSTSYRGFMSAQKLIGRMSGPRRLHSTREVTRLCMKKSREFSAAQK